MGTQLGGDAARGFRGREGAQRGRGRAMALPLLLLLSLLGAAPAAAALPDGRAYEQVSPSNKHGASVEPLGFGFQGPNGGIVESSENGERFTYVSDLPVEPEPEGNRAFEGNQTLSQRTPTGWVSKDIVTPHYHGEGLPSGNPQEYRLFSPDLAFAALQPYGELTKFEEPPLVAGLSSEERSVYRRNNLLCETTPVGCYEAIVNPANDTGTTEGKQSPYGGALELLAATPDLSHSVFVSQVPLTSPSSTEEPVGIYESDNSKPAAEQLQLVSVLPGAEGKPSVEAQLGGLEGENGKPLRDVVSNNGSRVFWSGLQTVTNKKGEELTIRHLFMRDTTTKATIRVDNPEEGVKENLTEAYAEDFRAHFEAASTDGSKIFFTSNASLTPEAKVHPKEFGAGAVELYVCEIPAGTEVTESTKCTLHDLTGGFKGPGDVVGTLSAVSEDGNYVYFVANGAPEEGTKGSCPNPTSTKSYSSKERCNLYVAHFNGQTWEAPKLIASISGADAPDFANVGTELGQLTARTSPKGEWFAFMSELPLTGYDNRDLNPLAKEAKDEEVFLYNSKTGHVSCVSCNPNKEQRPRGVFDQREAGEGFGLVVDPFSYVWENRWLAGSIPGWTSINIHQAPYQSRYLLEDGRLYFTSSDSLLPHEVETRKETIEGKSPASSAEEVGVENVYEYQPGGLGSCEASKEACVSLISSGTSEHESGFLDADTTGSNVFFVTAAKLVPTDLDTTFDAYDARECTSSSPCITPPPPPSAPCNSEANCRSGGPSGASTFESAPSSTFRGTGNLPKTEVLDTHTVKPPPKALTKAQKLARALAACRKKYKHSRGKRLSCEKQARRAYGAKSSVHKKAKKNTGKKAGK